LEEEGGIGPRKDGIILPDGTRQDKPQGDELKRILLCCDGTWNSFEKDVTNVVKAAYKPAQRAKGVAQLDYYHPGVGTGNWLDKMSGGLFGTGLVENVHDVYRFLVLNFELGDEIFLMGFSRGAFTARSVAGMIRKCGILNRYSYAAFQKAVELYRDAAVHPDDAAAANFRAENSLAGARAIPIQFIGVWDTVGALGRPSLPGLGRLKAGRFQFHDTELSGCVRFAFQALAIDERRATFKPTLWKNFAKPGQLLEQRWFCGAHSDVGGGYADSGLSDLALKWMMEKAQLAGLALDGQAAKRFPYQGNPLGPIHDSRTLLWKAVSIKPYLRKIGGENLVPENSNGKLLKKKITQSLDDSVLVRWDKDPKYRPQNLRDYFKLQGDPRGLRP
jgi:uncharacterized protein (DUF2235 family)